MNNIGHYRRTVIKHYQACYYMASSVSGQDEPNCALWLATRDGKKELSCPLRTTRRVPRKKNSESQIINPLLTKLFQLRWLDIDLVLFFASLWTLTPSRSINTQKELGQYVAVLTSRLVNNLYLWVTALIDSPAFGRNLPVQLYGVPPSWEWELPRLHWKHATVVQFILKKF